MAGAGWLAILPDGNNDARHRVIERRKWTVKDILATFEGHDFAFEIQHPVFLGINVVDSHGAPNGWTGNDVVSTMIKWSCYNDDAWRVIITYYTETDRAIRAREKLKRRIEAEFIRMDRREAPLGVVVTACSTLTTNFALEIPRRAENVRLMVVEQLLKVLEQICRRHDLAGHYLQATPEPGPLVNVLNALNCLSSSERRSQKPILRRIQVNLVGVRARKVFVDQMAAAIEQTEAPKLAFP